MPKKKRRIKAYPLDVPLPSPKPKASWLLRGLARLLRQIAAELQRSAGA